MDGYYSSVMRARYNIYIVYVVNTSVVVVKYCSKGMRIYIRSASSSSSDGCSVGGRRKSGESRGTKGRGEGGGGPRRRCLSGNKKIQRPDHTRDVGSNGVLGNVLQ